MVQDKLELVVIGSDVGALYPSLSDIEVALICYQAVINSNIRFSNINYRLLARYIASCLSETEQRFCPLFNILPRRTSNGGVKPGVSASIEKEDNWVYPNRQPTEAEERMMVATMVQIGVLVIMNTRTRVQV